MIGLGVHDAIVEMGSTSYDDLGRSDGWEDALLDRIVIAAGVASFIDAIDALPPSIRAIARMRWVDGMTITAISVASGIPRSTVHRRVWDAARSIGDMRIDGDDDDDV